jgi:predicted nucleic acid-binding protein
MNFLDSNVLLYLLDVSPKTARADQLLRESAIISVQVLNEFVRNARRKFKLSFEKIEKYLALIREHCDVVDLTLATHERALEIARATNFQFFDCNIIAAAELADCDVLYSEDMNDGQRIGRVTIRNPFV